MNTIKGLLIRNLAYFGFTYYPSNKRSMFKSQKDGKAFVAIVDMSEENKCTVMIDCDDFRLTQTFDVVNSSDLEAVINCATSASKVNESAKLAA